tara:strand:+ start:8676 stop:9038 length:363 start_codon:yes stop_codon:yes gene_type:complete
MLKSSDGLIDFPVSVPKEMGGKGYATNLEQLFAAGYAACFENAVIHLGRQKKVNVGNTSVDATVSIFPNSQGGFSLAVELSVGLPDMNPNQAQALIEEAHKVCPYSNATRGNIQVDLKLK